MGAALRRKEVEQSLMLLSGLFWRKGRFLDSCSCSEPHNRTKEKSPNTNCVQAQPKWSECFRCHLRRKRKGRTIEKSLNANCVQTQSGGRGWIRTTEVTDNRFTVCPLWPLVNSSVFTWSWWTDSNPRPADYKSAALPTELHQHIVETAYLL